MTAPEPRAGWRRAGIVLALVLAVLLTYSGARRLGFVRYDDPEYVFDNSVVARGLTLEGLRWACTAVHSYNWHPLTWLAHMLDVELYGLEPAGHHLSSVLLHALASALCFLALEALTRRTWPAALVAALFALHPLRVESVAWISERKDVLSGCAFFALLLAYARSVQAPARAGRAFCALWLALGLCAKPMLVSAPVVLLALDVWPLAREGTLRWREKLPLFLLCLLASGVALLSQRQGGALSSLEELPLGARLANAPAAVLRYAAHFLWPTDLAYFYPHPSLLAGAGPPWTARALLAALGLGAALATIVALRRRIPALALGVAWFLVMLVPVIGLVQVGEQALADRYAYLPVVGLQIALVYPLSDLAARRPRLRTPLAACAGLALLACALLTVRQVRTWTSSETLYRHALAVTARNYAAWNGLGNELARQGKPEEARAAFEQALASRPRHGPSLYGLALLAQQAGELARARELYAAASEAQPSLVEAWINLGALEAQAGRTVEAATAFERALARAPDHPDAHYDLALLLEQGGALEEACAHLEAAVRARPRFDAAWEELGLVRYGLGARAAARSALAAVSAPRPAAARLLAWILATSPEATPAEIERARALARQAVRATEHRDPDALEALAAAEARGGDFASACAAQGEALQLLPSARASAARARLDSYRRGQPVREE